VRHLHSELLDIPGVGPRTAQKLLRKFGSISNLRNASVEQLAAVATRPQAKRVYEYLHHEPTI